METSKEIKSKIEELIFEPGFQAYLENISEIISNTTNAKEVYFHLLAVSEVSMEYFANPSAFLGDENG